MKLSAPKQVTFVIALIVAIVGVISYFVTIPFLSAYVFWLLLISFVILAAGCLFKGL